MSRVSTGGAGSVPEPWQLVQLVRSTVSTTPLMCRAGAMMARLASTVGWQVAQLPLGVWVPPGGRP